MPHPVFDARQVRIDKSVPAPAGPSAEIFGDWLSRFVPVSFVGESYRDDAV